MEQKTKPIEKPKYLYEDIAPKSLMDFCLTQEKHLGRLPVKDTEMVLATKRAFLAQQRTETKYQIGDEKYDTYYKIEMLMKEGKRKRAENLLNDRLDKYAAETEEIAAEIISRLETQFNQNKATESQKLGKALENGEVESLILDYWDIQYCASELFKLAAYRS